MAYGEDDFLSSHFEIIHAVRGYEITGSANS